MTEQTRKAIEGAVRNLSTALKAFAPEKQVQIELYCASLEFKEALGTLRALLSTGGWATMDSAPKDGTDVLLWCVHANAKMARDKSLWVGPVVGRWIEHNGGGFSWDGHMGELTHWMPLPQPPAAGQEG